MSNNDPLSHSEASHSLPLDPIETILASIESWHF